MALNSTNRNIIFNIAPIGASAAYCCGKPSRCGFMLLNRAKCSHVCFGLQQPKRRSQRQSAKHCDGIYAMSHDDDDEEEEYWAHHTANGSQVSHLA